MRPLYLRGTEPLSVSLDGPALKVAGQGVADRRFPLERVSRVVVSNLVAWSTEALLACADEGITVCFLRSDGVPRARLTGRPSARSEFLQRWHDFVDRPDWEERFLQWRTAVRRRAIRFCAMRMGWSCRLDLADLVRIVLKPDESDGNDRRVCALRKQIHGLARTFAIAELAKLGLRADEETATQLIPVLATGVQWGLQPELVNWLRTRDGEFRGRKIMPRDDLKAAIFFVEKHSSAVNFHIRDVLLHLQRYMASLQ